MNTKNRLGYYFVPLPEALLLDTVSGEAVYLWGIIYLLQCKKRSQTNVEIFKLMPVSRNKVQRLLAELESAGWIVWNRKSTTSERFVLLTTKYGAGVGNDGAGVGNDGAGVNHLKTRVNPTGRAKGANRLCDRHETHERRREISHSHSHSHSETPQPLTDEQIKEIEEEEARKIKTFKTRLQKHEERSPEQ